MKKRCDNCGKKGIPFLRVWLTPWRKLSCGACGGAWVVRTSPVRGIISLCLGVCAASAAFWSLNPVLLAVAVVAALTVDALLEGMLMQFDPAPPEPGRKKTLDSPPRPVAPKSEPASVEGGK